MGVVPKPLISLFLPSPAGCRGGGGGGGGGQRPLCTPRTRPFSSMASSKKTAINLTAQSEKVP